MKRTNTILQHHNFYKNDVYLITFLKRFNVNNDKCTRFNHPDITHILYLFIKVNGFKPNIQIVSFELYLRITQCKIVKHRTKYGIASFIFTVQW